MKLAVITSYFPTSRQPWAGHSSFQTLRWLTQRCDLKVFYPELCYPKYLTPASAKFPPLDYSYQPEEIVTEYISYPTLPLVARPLNGYISSLRVLPRVRSFKPDIILNYMVYPDGFSALRVGKALKIPVVVTAIGSDLNRISDRFSGVLTRKTVHESDAIITVSHDLCKTAICMGSHPERSYAILNGCDTSIFHHRNKTQARAALNLDINEETIVYVGRLDVRKGLRELIEAAASLHQRRPQMRCYLVGDGTDEPALREAITQKNAADYVRLMPPCRTDGVAQWMAAADLVTLPSYMEGCPNVIIEALASGRPVVATNVGGIPELMDDASGRLVPPRDSAALASALDQVLAQSWDGDRIANLHSRSWSNVSDDVYRVLENTLATHK